MNLLFELCDLLEPILPVETAVFSNTAPDTYAVLTPLGDNDEMFCDNAPAFEVQEARISIFTRTNYIKLRSAVVSALRNAGITITDKRFVDREDITGYNHYAIDVAQNCDIEN